MKSTQNDKLLLVLSGVSSALFVSLLDYFKVDIISL
jgi:hypothetical protein